MVEGDIHFIGKEVFKVLARRNTTSKLVVWSLDNLSVMYRHNSSDFVELLH
jgi:hypothetical protein